MDFVWDVEKERANRERHGVSFDEAKELFTLQTIYGRSVMTEDYRELTKSEFERAMPRAQRERIMRGELQGGDDVVALRRFLGMTQQSFSDALGISVHTLRNWEQGRRNPVGPALALLKIAARHPRVLRENLAATA